MPKDVREISVFVSSPGDVGTERETVSEVCEEINLDVGRRLGFRIQPITWEAHTVPQISDRSQEAINEQIDEYDVYLGIMGTRFGSSTGVYGSGTEEEFEIAISRNQATGQPEIQFYFSDSGESLGSIDLGQYSKVREFQENIGSRGVYHKVFKDATHFRAMVRNGLYDVAIRMFHAHEKSGSKVSQSSEDQSAVRYDLQHLSKLISSDAEAALNYYAYRATSDMDAFAKNLNEASRKTVRITKAMGSIAGELPKLDLQNPKKARAALKKVDALFSDLEKFNDWFSSEIPVTEKNFRSSVSNFQRAALLVPEGDIEEQLALDVAVDELKTLRGSMAFLRETAWDTGEKLAATTGGGARFDSNAKIFGALLMDFSSFLDRADASVDEVLQSAEF